MVSFDSKMQVYSTLLLSTGLAFIGGVRCFPTTTGSCASGTQALLQPFRGPDLRVHGLLDQVGGGPISDFNLTLSINDEALDPSTPFEIETGFDYTLSLTASSEPFSGFLFRLASPDGTRTLDSLLPIETTDESTGEASTGGVQIATQCQIVEFVGGVSHMTSSRKQQIDANLNMESPAEGLILDVTVVIETSQIRNISHWYYSQYTLNAVRPQEDDPTKQPTWSPTKAPSPEPTEPTTETPTESSMETPDSSSAFRQISIPTTFVVAFFSSIDLIFQYLL